MIAEDLKRLLEDMTAHEREQLLRLLRDRYGIKIHPIEIRWNTSAESILEAIDTAGDLTQRGVRGVLAEATFRSVVLRTSLLRWRELSIVGEQPYDLLLDDGQGSVRVQVKLQRRIGGIPMYFKKSSDQFVVETQRTRGGKRKNDEQSRPYRVTEFDVLAVCLHPSANDWTRFAYCATRDLLVRADDPQLLDVMQPIPVNGSESWSYNFEWVVTRFRRG